MFIIFTSRFYVLGVLNNPFVIGILVIWFFVIMIVNLFLQYTKFFIVIENESVLDAMKKSIGLSAEHLKITTRFFFISYVLQIRFIINVFIVIGVPLFLIYLAIKFNLTEYVVVQYIIYAILILQVIISAYINGIIEAFFVTFWYKVFKLINIKE